MKFAWILVASSALAQTAAKPPPDKPRTPAEQLRAAMALQREAARKQAQSVGVWRLPWSPVQAAVDTPCDPMTDTAVAPIIASAATTQNLDPKLLNAVIEQESGYHPCAVSSAGAMGLMQLMPATADELEVKDAFDARQNVEAGAKYLRQLIDKYKGDLPQALGAYNAGPSTVDRAGGVPHISETTNYVEAILKKLGTSADKPPPAAPPGSPPALPGSSPPPGSPPALPGPPAPAGSTPPPPGSSPAPPAMSPQPPGSSQN